MAIEILYNPTIIGAIIGAIVGAIASAVFAIITEWKKFSKEKKAPKHLYSLKFLILLNYLSNLGMSI